MQLADYLREQGRGAGSDLARAIGVAPAHLWKISVGQTWPSREIIQAIERETDGAVTAADIVWFDRRRVKRMNRIVLRDEAAA